MILNVVVAVLTQVMEKCLHCGKGVALQDLRKHVDSCRYVVVFDATSHVLTEVEITLAQKEYVVHIYCLVIITGYLATRVYLQGKGSTRQ